LIFVDASYIIALVLENDKWHERALALMDNIVKEDKVITHAMIIETINHIGKCKGGKAGKTIFQYIKDNYLIFNKDYILDKAMREYIKYDGKISLADSTAIITMKELDIYQIYSFDSDFDKVSTFQRVF